MDFEHKTGYARTLTSEEPGVIKEKSLEYIIAYGIRQSLQDSMAIGKDGTAADAEAGFAKRLRKLMEGSMDIREVTRSSDPVKTETRRLANEFLDELVRTKAIGKPDKDLRKFMVAELMKDEMRVETARENVERANARKATVSVPDSIKALLGLKVEEPVVETPAKRKK